MSALPTIDWSNIRPYGPIESRWEAVEGEVADFHQHQNDEGDEQE